MYRDIFSDIRKGLQISLRLCPSIKNYAEDHGREPVGESVPAEGWKLLKGQIL